jgi:hypothetical protein
MISFNIIENPTEINYFPWGLLDSLVDWFTELFPMELRVLILCFFLLFLVSDWRTVVLISSEQGTWTVYYAGT